MAEEGKNEVPEDEANMSNDAASEEADRLLHSVAEYAFWTMIPCSEVWPRPTLPAFQGRANTRKPS